jgi:hypothetical protein
MSRISYVETFGPPLSESVEYWSEFGEILMSVGGLVSQVVESACVGADIAIRPALVDSSAATCALVPEINNPARKRCYMLVMASGLVARLTLLVLGTTYFNPKGGVTGIVDGVYYDDYVDDKMRYDVLKKRVPPSLEGAFLPYMDPIKFWPWISAEICKFEKPGMTRLHAAPVVSTACGFLAAHEVAHAVLDHDTVYKKLARDALLSPEERAAYERAVEVDADIWAATAHVTALLASANLAAAMGASGTAMLSPLLEDFTWAYLLANIFGEPAQRGLRSYETPLDLNLYPIVRHYPHPAVRERIVNRTLFELLERELGSKRALQMLEVSATKSLDVYGALNEWYLKAIKSEQSSASFAIPHPYNFLHVAFRRTNEKAEEIMSEYGRFIARYRHVND